ncbi:zf-DHHC-domain-containing protein [Abortiporus biennis]|nr:zf-DHHC-domain-containing protein [Abortiporus biennis]
MSRDHRPLISLGPVSQLPPPTYAQAHDDEENEKDAPPKRWYNYLPLCAVVVMLLAPHPSLLIVLVNYHLKVLDAPVSFAQHLTVTYALTFLALTSLIVILARDPGPVTTDKKENSAVEAEDREDINVLQALLSTNDDDIHAPGKWCRKCWAPKPERTHHCSACGRCILKMDHHCAWLGYKCLGHRTYTSFLHFLLCITLLSMYISSICISALYFAFTNPISIDETTPVHEMFLAFAGIIITIVVGPFFLYHMYLVWTNQTTLEHLSPFLLLRQLPELPEPPADGRKLSDPPLEHELSYRQRMLVREAHGYIRQYDMGWRKNFEQVFGWDRPFGWIWRILLGGGGKGDGRTFPRNPRADELLARLAADLVDADKVH